MTTIVAHNTTPLPAAIPQEGITTRITNWITAWLKACNGELVETCLEWTAEQGLKLLAGLSAGLGALLEQVWGQ